MKLITNIQYNCYLKNAENTVQEKINLKVELISVIRELKFNSPHRGGLNANSPMTDLLKFT